MGAQDGEEMGMNNLKVGDTITITGLREYRARRWFEIWKPRWIDMGEQGPRRYTIIDKAAA